MASILSLIKERAAPPAATEYPVDGAGPTRTPRRTRWAYAGATLAGIAVTFFTFRGGYLTVDPTFQFLHARRHTIDDWHAPVMAWMWQQVDHVVRGTLGMFALQVIPFWVGLALILAGRLGGRARYALVLLAIGLCPPVFGLLSTIWKDIQMSAALLLAFGLLLQSERHASRTALLLANVPLLYALMLRHNAAAAVLPIAIWMGFLALPAFGYSARARVALPLGMTLLAGHLAASRLVEEYVIRPSRAYPVQAIYIHDLAAISLETGQIELPDYLRNRGISLAELRDGFREDTSDYLIWKDEARLRSLVKADIDALRRCWWKTIRAHPGLYLMHRWRVFRAFLAYGRAESWRPLVSNVLPEHLKAHRAELGVPEFQIHPWNALVTRQLERLKDTALFRPWLYALLLAAVAVAQLRRRAADPAVLTLLASASLYLVGYFPIAPAGDFRYAWWSAVAALALVAIVLGTPSRRAPSS